ncbi:hypothetical protein CJ030_MR3G019017 [Morella rubra]|uniref:Uncharacterized protein n=1 Tax=Morella rubra TaxID=262757 RepID=A0A6A1W4Z2_9ROSI|nr:hypothetical protein CJ030_MR3G019017 [Morella rubra]
MDKGRTKPHHFIFPSVPMKKVPAYGRWNKPTVQQLTVVDVRGHYKRLEHAYRAFKELITVEGFFCDKEANVLLVTTERWENYLEIHPKAAKFRAKGCAHFSLLEWMFFTKLPLQPVHVVVALPV